MAKLIDETGYSAGGGGGPAAGEKTRLSQVSRPDPYAVKAAVAQEIIAAKQAAGAAEEAAETEFSSRESEIVDREYDAIDKAGDAWLEGEVRAAVPVREQQTVVAELEAQLRRAKMDLSARKVVFRAAKFELKSAFEQAVSGIIETTAADIAAAKTARAQAVFAAQDVLAQAKSQGASTIQEEKDLLRAYEHWQSDMKWAGRKAGFNAVAQTVVAIVNAAKDVYQEAATAERANVPVPDVLLKRQEDGPEAPAA